MTEAAPRIGLEEIEQFDKNSLNPAATTVRCGMVEGNENSNRHSLINLFEQFLYFGEDFIVATEMVQVNFLN